MFDGKRLLSVTDAMTYTGLGKNRLYDFGKESGCMVKYGKRTFFDRIKIDQAIDNEIGFKAVKEA